MRPMILAFVAILLENQLSLGPRQPGTIAGRVEIKAPPPEQVASRYPSPAGQGQKSVVAIPTVVFLDGPVTGSPAWPLRLNTAVVQRNLQFSPPLLIVPKGTAVSFPNEDDEFHNVFSYSKAKRFDLGRYRKGESKSVALDRSGIIKVYCEIHPWMRAAILVLDNPFYAIASPDGSFAITGIPAGHYDLVAWNIDVGSSRVRVDVTTGPTPELRVKLSGGPDSEVRQQRLSVGALATGWVQSPDPRFKRPCCAGK
jgi:plastocyanin